MMIYALHIYYLSALIPQVFPNRLRNDIQDLSEDLQSQIMNILRNNEVMIRQNNTAHPEPAGLVLLNKQVTGSRPYGL